jgi:hypothetical protein
VRGIAGTLILSILHTSGIMCFLGLASVFYGPMGKAEFAAMAVFGIALAVAVWLAYYAGMALRWALGGDCDD